MKRRASVVPSGGRTAIGSTMPGTHHALVVGPPRAIRGMAAIVVRRRLLPSVRIDVEIPALANTRLIGASRPPVSPAPQPGVRSSPELIRNRIRAERKLPFAVRTHGPSPFFHDVHLVHALPGLDRAPRVPISALHIVRAGEGVERADRACTGPREYPFEDHGCNTTAR